MKIAIVFDNKRRPDTTGVYCLRALEKKHEVVHCLPENLSGLRGDPYDAYINIDDGFNYRFPKNLRPSIFWAIDTHMKPERCRERAQDFNLVFCAQRRGAEEMRKAGIAARWCPLAFDPEVHRKHSLPKILDISFVGHFGRFRYKGHFWEGKRIFRERARLVSLLKKKFNLYSGNFFFEDLAVVYSISKMVFNRSVVDDVNMRVFEALGCGSLLVTNQIGPGQDLLFKPGKHLIEYRSSKDLVAAVKYYLHHEQEREKIATQGREEAFKKHTYAHRMDYMLSFLNLPTQKRFDFSGVQGDRDFSWDYEQKALSPYCHGKGVDVGCGPRKVHPQAVGIDILKEGSQAGLLSSGDQLPLPNGELDYVVSCHNLEHYADTQKTLTEWKRVLKKGGVLGAVVPDDRIIDTLSLNAQHQKGFTPEWIRREVAQNGGWEIEVMQEIVDAWSFGFILRKIEEAAHP